MIRRNAVPALSLVLLAVLPSGCDPGPPEGQVIARIDGEEVTRRDLLIELQASTLPPGVDVGHYRKALLDAVVARKLLAQAARQEGIDTTPEYLAAIRRDREQWLVQFLRSRDAARLSPATADVASHAANRDAAYAGRQLLTIDRLRLADTGTDRAIDTQGSVDNVAARLDAAGRRYRRDRVVEDSLALSGARLAKLMRTADGVPLRTDRPGEVIVERLITVMPAPVPSTMRPAVARDELERNAREHSDTRRIAMLRARARIEYQPGYAP